MERKKPLVIKPLHSEEFYADQSAGEPTETEAGSQPGPVPATQSPDQHPAPVPPPSSPATPPASPHTPPAPKNPSPSPSNPQFPRGMRLVLVVFLTAFAAAAVSMTTSASSTFIQLILALPALAVAWKRIEGVLLPYAVGAGFMLSVSYMKRILEHWSSGSNVRSYVAVFSDHSDAHTFLLAGIAAILLAAVAYGLTAFGPRAGKLFANVVFRFLAIWLIFYSASAGYLIAQQAEFKEDQADYSQALGAHRQTNLDDRLPVYTSILPGGFERYSVAGSNEDHIVTGYEERYSDSAKIHHDITVRVSLATIPQSCERTMNPQVRRASDGQFYSCNIVLTGNGGQEIYGYRGIASQQPDGIDPLAVPASELRKIQPARFYIQKGDVRIELENYTPPDSTTPSPLTPAAVRTFADSLQPADNTARQNFINTYIKPRQPVQPKDYSGPYKKDVIQKLIVAFYLSLLLWSWELIFTKAGRRYWKAYAPILNFWELSKIAGKPGWWSLFAFLPSTPYDFTFTRFVFQYIFLAPILIPLMTILTIVRFILFLLFSTSMAQKFGKPRLFSLLLIIPPFPGYLILGFGKSQYQDAKPVSAAPDPPRPTATTPPPALR